jgi:hypothetical protein
LIDRNLWDRHRFGLNAAVPSVMKEQMFAPWREGCFYKLRVRFAEKM